MRVYLCDTTKHEKMNFEIGLNLYKEGKFEEALVCFNWLIEQQKGKTELHLYRGRILSRLGKGEAALEDFDFLVQMEPYNTDYISDRGVVLHLLGRDQEALTEFDRAANLDPYNPYRYSSRAFFKDRIGDLAGAIEDYEKAIELDPEDAIAYNNKGLVEEKMGYREKAKRSFTKADDLVGYKPESKSSDLPPIGSPAKKTGTPTQLIRASENQKLNVGHFWKTLKSVFTESQSQKEFFGFVKSLFSGKKPKNS